MRSVSTDVLLTWEMSCHFFFYNPLDLIGLKSIKSPVKIILFLFFGFCLKNSRNSRAAAFPHHLALYFLLLEKNSELFTVNCSKKNLDIWSSIKEQKQCFLASLHEFHFWKQCSDRLAQHEHWTGNIVTVMEN